MIILQAANFVSPTSGGIGTLLDALARGYTAAGHDVVQVIPGAREQHTLADGILRVELPSVPVPRTGYRLITDRARLRSLLSSWQPDRAEVSDKLTLRWVGSWARRRGIPAVMWSHERLDGLLDRARVPLPRRFVDHANRQIARSFDAVVAPSEWAAAEFRRLGYVPTSVVPLGVDLATFHPARADDRLRRELGGDAEVVLAAAVRLSAEKEPHHLGDTLRRLLIAGVDASLVIAGDGPLRASLERRWAGLPVRFLGHLSERTSVAAMLASADVVLAPGPVETFGLTVLEALACGTPVVGRRSGAVGEILRDRDVTAHGHARDFVRAVTTVLSRDAIERRAAARAVAERYPWDNTVRTMLRLLGADDGVSSRRVPQRVSG